MSWVMWITGDAGDATTRVATEVARALTARGDAAVALDTACMRRLLAPGARSGDTPDVVDRALVHLAGLLSDAGVPTVLYGADRAVGCDLARAALPWFAEVRVAAADPGAGTADLVIDVGEDPRRAASGVLDVVGALAPRAPARRKPEAPGWAIWITGMPGSGKTTLAWAAADVLASRGMPVAVVDWARLARFATPGGPHCPHETDVLRRTMLAAVVLLTDAGIAVLVDATAPERAWRDVARERISHFAEVQLLCAPAIAGDRERAVRWGLTPCAQGRGTSDVMEVVVGYEPAHAPEVTLQTDVVDVSTATAEIVHLAERLTRACRETPIPNQRSTTCVSTS